LISIHTRADIYEADVISASMSGTYFFQRWRISTIRSIETCLLWTGLCIITEIKWTS